MAQDEITRATFAEVIESVAGGDILACVIGRFGRAYYYDDDDTENRDERDPINLPQGKVLMWPEARSWLDYQWSQGYGTPDCHSIYAYTADKIVFVSTYDGSTRVCSMPRDPRPCNPEMPGGG